jgi:hypothetical protein
MYDPWQQRSPRDLDLFRDSKLLGSPIDSADTRHQRYAVLSQRLALDINTTAYISSSPIVAETTLEQITNHMRVCVVIGKGIETIRGVLHMGSQRRDAGATSASSGVLPSLLG